MVQISGKSSKLFWCMRSGRATRIPLSLDRSISQPKVEGLRDIGHSLSIGNLILRVSSVTVSYVIHYDSLLQNATDVITKCDSYLIKNCDRSWLQNASGFLLQNATILLLELPQIAMILLQNATFITNCNSITS